MGQSTNKRDLLAERLDEAFELNARLTKYFNTGVLPEEVLQDMCKFSELHVKAIENVLGYVTDHAWVWIPCTYDVPATDEKVLCCTQNKKGDKNIVIGYYADGKWRCGMNNNVIAWQPLPEVYDDHVAEEENNE